MVEGEAEELGKKRISCTEPEEMNMAFRNGHFVS